LDLPLDSDKDTELAADAAWQFEMIFDLYRFIIFVSGFYA